MKEESIEFKHLSNNVQCIIVISFAIALFTGIYTGYYLDNQQKQIDNLPHKICHNETSYGRIFQIEENGLNLGDIREYSSIKLNCISPSICLEVLNQTEVCEIK